MQDTDDSTFVQADEALRYAVTAFLGAQLMTYTVTFKLNPAEEPAAH